MSSGWRADGPDSWSCNAVEQDKGWPNQSAPGWGIGNGWGVSETNVGDQEMVSAEPSAEQTAAVGWGNINGWGPEVGTAKAEVERKTSVSSTISPKDEPRRSLTLDLHMPVS